ncbi:MAG: hypothetical protein ABIT38_02940, partial [Gemmatimonadaceae bacterium]
MDRDRRYLATLSPELRLLVLSAGPSELDAELRATVEKSNVDWELVIELADFERATAIVWRRIRTFAPATIPAAMRQKFEQMSMVADFASSLLEQRASETLSTLGTAGIEAVALKGV